MPVKFGYCQQPKTSNIKKKIKSKQAGEDYAIILGNFLTLVTSQDAAPVHARVHGVFSRTAVVNDQPAKCQCLPACSAAGFVQPQAVWDPRPPPLTLMRMLMTEFHKPALRRASLPILVSPNTDGAERGWYFVFKQAQTLVKLLLGKWRLSRVLGFKERNCNKTPGRT